jgi:predicted Rossmann fold flavoprotein
MQHQKTLVVVGGGAAGFFCAINAARLDSSLKVILLEKSGKLLQKVKVSGGGRCNVTHHLFEIIALSKCYPRGEKFIKKAYHHFNPTDTIQWFEEKGVKLKTEADGRMFPLTNTSQTIIDCLVQEAERYEVEIWMHAAVKELKFLEKECWELSLSDDRKVEANFVCIACGGFSKVEQFDWITRNTGHTVVPPVPSLFTFNIPGHPLTKLMGVSQVSIVKVAGTDFSAKGPVLITHWGLSGPAILKTSAFAARFLAEKNYEFDIIINWMPDFNENSLREKILVYRQEKGNKKVINTEWVGLPERLFMFILRLCEISDEQRWSDLPSVKQNKLIKTLTGFQMAAKGKTTFKEEFVTAGGIPLSEIEANTMQSKLKPGLYFAGEIMDVDGITGGFNFQHAWTSGMLSARHIASGLG